MSSLLLVDFENMHRLDISGLSSAFEVIIFIGPRQKAPPLASAPFRRHGRPKLSAVCIKGYGKNALDFHIAFHLGRVFETARDTLCYILSKDKGFDPLLRHINNIGLNCRRLESLQEISSCPLCDKRTLIEHKGGTWCSNCGRFVVNPGPRDKAGTNEGAVSGRLICASCRKQTEVGDGLYDKGEWICGDCISSHAITVNS